MKCCCCRADTRQLVEFPRGVGLPRAFGCKKCGHVFTDCPNNLDLEDFYCNEYRSEERDTAFFEESVREKYEKGILARFKRVAPDFKPNSILEVGAGIGYLLQRTLKDFNLNPESATTCELNKNHAEDLEKQGFNSISGDFISVDFKKRFDLFIAIDIIEHIKDVSAVPRKIKQLISKDGLALIQVPTRRQVKPWTETTHFHYFNPISFHALFRNIFEIVGIFDNDLEETGKGPTLLGVIKNKNE
jgi:SAM-dependent methyltransferase